MNVGGMVGGVNRFCNVVLTNCSYNATLTATRNISTTLFVNNGGLFGFIYKQNNITIS